MQRAVRYQLDAQIARITLNRPECLNAVNQQLLVELCEALERSINDEALAVVLTGAGRAFCAGHDLKQPLDEADHTGRAQDVMRLVRRSPAPVIAAVNGYAVGAGCEFALCSDVVIAGRTARFAFPEVSVGLSVTGGISHVLPLSVGPVRAKELVLFGDEFSSERALELGLVNRVVEDRDVVRLAQEWAERLAALPTDALRNAKQLLDRGMQVDLEAAMHLELLYSQTSLDTHDAREVAREFQNSRRHGR